MAKDTGRKWRNIRVICVNASQRAAANARCLAFTPSWGPDFFSIPLFNKTSHNIQEYAADVVLTDDMMVQLATIPNNILKAQDIETPTTKAKGSARVKEVAAKRNLDTSA